MGNWLKKSEIIIIALLLVNQISLSINSEIQKSIVKQVIDGNTIKLDNDEIIRYIGVGDSSIEYNKALVEGKKVRIEFDEKKTDEEEHILAYVYRDEIFINAEIIKNGYGSVFLVSPNTKYAEDFLRLEKEARSAKTGIWSETKDNATIKTVEVEIIPSLLERILSLENEIKELKAKINELTEIIDILRPSNGDKIKAVSQKETEKKANNTLDKKSIVYISIKAGEKYHINGCRFLGEDIKSLTMENAEKNGYKPCKVCFPEHFKNDK